MKHRNIARLGFIAYAVFAAVVPFALILARRAVEAEIDPTHGHDAHSPWLALIGYAETAAIAGVALAFWAIAHAFNARNERTLAIAAAWVCVFDVMHDLVWYFTSVGSFGGVDHPFLVSRLSYGIVTTTALAVSVLSALIFLRIGRAASLRFVRPLVAIHLAAGGVYVLMRIMSIADVRWESLGPLSEISRYLPQATTVGLAALLLRCLHRIKEPEATPSEPSQLDPQWREVSSAITAYLFALGARLLLVLIGAVVASGGRSTSSGNRADIAIGVFFFVAFSMLSSVVMLRSVSCFRRAPHWCAERAASIAFGLMSAGLILEVISAAVIVSALDGSMSAAFRARDAMSLLIPLTTLVSGATGAALLSVFASFATELNLWNAAKSARGMVRVVLIAGRVASLALLTVSIMPSALFALTVAGSIFAMVPASIRFLIVGVQLIQEINARAGQPGLAAQGEG